MTIDRPPAIARYFASERGRSADDFSLHFTADAVLRDDGRVQAHAQLETTR